MEEIDEAKIYEGLKFATRIACDDANRTVGFNWDVRMDFFVLYYDDAIMDFVKHPGKFNDVFHAVRAWHRYAVMNWCDECKKRIRRWNKDVEWQERNEREQLKPSAEELEDAESELLASCPEPLKFYVHSRLAGRTDKQIMQLLHCGNNHKDLLRKHVKLWLEGRYDERTAERELRRRHETDG